MLDKHTVRFGLAALLFITGCAFNRVDTAWPKPRPLGSDLAAYHPPVRPSDSGSADTEFREPTGQLTLRDALSLALMRNPELAAYSWEVRAGEARMLQAHLLPNPEIEAETEEFGGSGERRGLNAAESTLRLGQLIELGGKRSKRTRVARLDRNLNGWDYESQRLDVLTKTTKAFIEVLSAQRRLSLSENIVGLSEKVLEVVSERVQAGRDAPLEETKADVELATARIKLERDKRELEAARNRLASSWGSTDPAFARVEGDLEMLREPPPLDELARLISLNPDIARWDTEMERRRAAVALEKARAIPDLTVGGGVQRFEETDDGSFIFGLAIPFPLFDRNQGGILESRYELEKALQERRATYVQVKTNLSRTYQYLSSSYIEAVSLRKDVLPAAMLAFNVAQEGYGEGKFEYIQVLDAQRTLFESDGQYINALAVYHKTVADAERLIGQGLHSKFTTESNLGEAENES